MQPHLEGVLALGCDVGDGALGARRQHDAVLDQGVFLDDTVNVAADDVVADLKGRGHKIPAERLVQSRGVDTTGNVDTARDVLNSLFSDTGRSTSCVRGGEAPMGSKRSKTNLERALDTVKDGVHDTRTELNRQGLAGHEHGVTDGETG